MKVVICPRAPGAQSSGGVARGRASGFTLIEVMITVVIIAVLTAIAYPSYENHVTKTRRAAAAGCLLERAQFMERFYTTNLSYLDSADTPPPIAQCPDLEGHYEVQLAAVDARTYTLQATPEGRQASKDANCGRLSLNHQGVRDVSGPGTVAQCW